MEKSVYSVEGNEIKSIELDDEVFNRKVNDKVIYYAIKNELANRRVGTASTKTRSEVRGSGAKPWRQKGTGRARAGTRKSPIWVGGGVTFGPKPRDYSYSIPKKMKRLAMKSILSLKNQENRLKIVEDFTVKSGKTRDLVAILKNLVTEERTVLVLAEDDNMIKRAGSNIPWLGFLSYNRLRAHDLFYGKNVLMLESAALKLNEFYNNKKREVPHGGS
ncbi:MAG: 50S ribosomal protein L4 [Spirochaetes bacterium]|nr:MAG: 50S ribosomal protein L4 [Spirochaetota bacterium]